MPGSRFVTRNPTAPRAIQHLLEAAEALTASTVQLSRTICSIVLLCRASRLPSDRSRNPRRRSVSVGASQPSPELPLIPSAARRSKTRRPRENKGPGLREEIKAFEWQRRKKDPIIAGHGVKWLLEIETRVGRFTNPSSHLNWIPPRRRRSPRDW